MRAKKYFTVDKSAWGDGEWRKEPDKLQWLDKRSGLPCLIVRACITGALCGYVGVPPGHPLYGKPYSEIEERVEVHGGLTFSDRCHEGDEQTAICHVPAAGEDADVWWFGFDCAHAGDVSPKMDATLAKIAPDMVARHAQQRAEMFKQFGRLSLWEERYRSVAYVRREVRRLAAQLAGEIE